MRSLFNQVQRMKLDVATIAPVHGKPVPWSAFVNGDGRSRALTRVAGAGGALVKAVRVRTAPRHELFSSR